MNRLNKPIQRKLTNQIIGKISIPFRNQLTNQLDSQLSYKIDTLLEYEDLYDSFDLSSLI